MINLYVGYDKNEDEAAKVCAYSVKKNCSVAVNINFLKIIYIIVHIAVVGILKNLI